MYSLNNNIAYKMLVGRKSHKFIANIDEIILMITPILNEICIHFNNYTLHNIEHSLRVLYNMCAIAGKSNLNKLSDLELAMIIYVALLHDVGMWISPDEIEKIESNPQFKFYLKRNCEDKSLSLQDYIRPIHGKRAYQYLMNDEKLNKLLTDSRLSTVSFLEDVALICQSHMESIDWINKNLKENFTKGYPYNSKYIALLLRIADYIDFDSQRAPQYLLEHKNLNQISLTEWKKHAVVCNLEKIRRVGKENEIFLDMECNDFNLYCKLMDTIELMNKEVHDCVFYSNFFADTKYHLPIKGKIQYRIETKGFAPERFAFSLDYDRITTLLMGENLYGDKKYGFRELLQNCFDACNVMKECYLNNDPTSNYEPQISIIYDYDNEVIVIRDNGTGMSKDIIKKYFLTIGKSYYRSEEYEKLRYKTNTTGTFGIGFLACFMLSNKVTISTKYYSTGEASTFSLEKDSKYICYLNHCFSGVHGTAITLSMDEFNKVFSINSLLRFIDDNFYSLDVKVNLYNQRSNTLTYIDQAKAIQLTNYLNIDLSPYLNGIECKAYLVTILEEFKLYNSFLEVSDDVNNIILFSSNGIELVPKKLMYEHKKKRCVILYSTTSFEELICQTFDNDQCFDGHIFDIDEFIEGFEEYGYKFFASDFNKSLEESREPWINSFDAMGKMAICVLWDDSFESNQIQDIVHRTKIRYLLDIGAMSQNLFFSQEKGYVINSSSVYEDFESNELVFSYNSNYITSYSTKVCYRGVLLNDVNLRIPHIPNILTEVNVTANILRSDFIPSVTRRGLTDEQEQVLSYAIGRAIYMYLLNILQNDEEIKLALKNSFYIHYSQDNLLC